MAPPPAMARAPFPARTCTSTEDIGGIATVITTTRFSDKLMVTISQDGRLAIWVRSPPPSPSPSARNVQLRRNERNRPR
jgi:proteasome assembly chaperone 3